MTERGRRLLKALDEVRAIMEGGAKPGTYRVHTVGEIAARLARKRMGMTQVQFATTYGLDLRTVQDWEQGRREPSGPARVLLQVIVREPAAVKRALATPLAAASRPRRKARRKRAA